MKPFILSVILVFSLTYGVKAQRNSCNCTLPVITSQPVSQSGLCSGQGQVNLNVVAESATSIVYQWLVDGVAISNDSVFSGCNSANLVIHNPPSWLEGQGIVCRVHNCLNVNVNSVVVTLSFSFAETDINQDGNTNTADFNLLLSNFDTACEGCGADINKDGEVNIVDFLKLLSRFNTSCY